MKKKPKDKPDYAFDVKINPHGISVLFKCGADIDVLSHLFGLPKDTVEHMIRVQLRKQK